MNQKLYFPKITASTIEEFTSLIDSVKKLPQEIIEQIESVSPGSVGINCELKDSCKGSKIYLPASTSQISHFGTYVGIYCKPFFFTIEFRGKEQHFEYLIDNIYNS